MFKKTILSAGLIAAVVTAAVSGTTKTQAAETLQIGVVPTTTITDPIPIGYGNSFTLNFVGNGKAESTVLLALLIPGDTGNFTDSFKVSTTVDNSTYSGSATFNAGTDNTGLTPFGLSNTTTTPNNNGYWGKLTDTSDGKLTDIMGGSFSSSENTSNFFGFDNNVPNNTTQWGLDLSPATTEFGVYSLLITTGYSGTLVKGDTINISDAVGSLPVGSIIAALSYTSSKNDNTYYTTPWTESGGVNGSNPTPLGPPNSQTPVSIPATLPLLGSGLLGLGLIALRKRRQLGRQ